MNLRDVVLVTDFAECHSVKWEYSHRHIVTRIVNRVLE